MKDSSLVVETPLISGKVAFSRPKHYPFMCQSYKYLVGFLRIRTNSAAVHKMHMKVWFMLTNRQQIIFVSRGQHIPLLFYSFNLEPTVSCHVLVLHPILEQKLWLAVPLQLRANSIAVNKHQVRLGKLTGSFHGSMCQ